MLKVLNCVVAEHDLWLVALAASFCLTASLTAFKLYARGRQATGLARLTWILLTGASAGSGIWATHFIAMLAYQPQLPVGYEPSGSVLSLLIAVGGTAGAFALAMSGARAAAAGGGVLFGAGVAAMHYTGMHAFRPQGLVLWDQPTVVASLALGIVFPVAAFFACADGRDWRRRVTAAALLALGICSLHFIGMSAVAILPDPTSPAFANGLTRGQMVIGVGLLTAVVIIGSVFMLLIDLHGRRFNAERMRVLFDANPVPMWLLEASTLRFLQVNQSAVREYGYSADQFAGMTAYDILHPDEHQVVRTGVVRPSDRPYQGDRLWRHLRADGSQMLIQPFTQIIQHDGERAYLTGLFDMTVREGAAVAMRNAVDAAERANRAKSDFLANMSHEIRTPLNGVIGVAGALERTELSVQQREMVEIIEDSASTLQRLLSDVLDTARIEAGELKLEARPFNLRAVIAAAAHLHGAAAEAKGLACTAEVDPDCEGWAVGDADRVSQIVGNLLNNAVKFTEAGAVSLRAHRLEDRVRFEVSDTGIGFTAEFHARLFDRFEQADASVTRRFGGSGLGLSIASDLARRMGGALTARSIPREGSTFVLELPLPACPAPQVGEVADAAAMPSLSILLADDHATNRRVVELILAPLGVRLTMVENGAEAVAAFAAGHFDLVLMDLQMPVMDGLEAIRRIRALELAQGASAATIYVLSANAMPEHLAASRAAGACDHLAKPIQARALIEAVINAAEPAAAPVALVA